MNEDEVVEKMGLCLRELLLLNVDSKAEGN